MGKAKLSRLNKVGLGILILATTAAILFSVSVLFPSISKVTASYSADSFKTPIEKRTDFRMSYQTGDNYKVRLFPVLWQTDFPVSFISGKEKNLYLSAAQPKGSLYLWRTLMTEISFSDGGTKPVILYRGSLALLNNLVLTNANTNRSISVLNNNLRVAVWLPGSEGGKESVSWNFVLIPK